MRFRLRSLIAVLLVLCLTPVVLVSTVLLVRVARQQFWQEAERYAVSFADTVLSATRRSMLEPDRAELEAIIQAVSRQKGIRAVRVYDGDGRFRVPGERPSSDLDLAGPGCTACHPDPRHIDAVAKACAHRGDDTLRLFQPISNEPACLGSGCHPKERQLLGLLEVEVDLTDAIARSRRLTAWSVFWSLLVLAGAVVPLLFAFRWAMERPLAESLRIVRGVAAGDMGVRSRLSPVTEWGELLKALDAMSSALGNARAQLEALNRDLEVQVANRTRALETALEQARESDRMRTELLGGISHEFATPLQGAVGYAELLLDGIDGDLTASQRHDVDVIAGNCRHLLELVEDLLELARLSRSLQASSAEEVRLGPIIQDVVAAGRRLAGAKPLEVAAALEPDCPAVLGDGESLRHLLFHLVEYAVRHTEEGRVSVHMGRAADGSVEITVSATGPGSEPEVLRSALEGYSPRGGGAGLGVRLAAARHLVEARGGVVAVESVPGGGTRVRIRAPAAKPPGEVQG